MNIPSSLKAVSLNYESKLGSGSKRAFQFNGTCIIGLSWAIASIVIIHALFFPEASALLGPWYFALGIVFLGMPHGAIDVILMVSRESRSSVSLSSGALIAIYLSVAAAYAFVWMFLPSMAFALFMLLTAFHWGTTEFGAVGKRRGLWLSLGVSRGLSVMLAVLAFHLPEAISALAPISLPFEPNLILQNVFMVLFICSVVWHFASLFYRKEKESVSLYRASCDFTIAVLLLIVTHPLVGVGVYYLFFHAVRYFAWFPQDDSKSQLTLKKLFKNGHYLSLALFLIFLLTLFLLNIELDLTSGFAAQILPYHLMFLSGVTIPHAILAFILQSKKTDWHCPMGN